MQRFLCELQFKGPVVMETYSIQMNITSVSSMDTDCCSSLEFSLNTFTEFAEFSNKKKLKSKRKIAELEPSV